MKNLKYLSFVLMTVIGLGTLHAQEKSLTEVNRDAKKQEITKTDRSKKMHQALDLSEAQTAEIKEIRAKRAAEKSQLKNELKQLNQAERDEIQAIYTPEQKEKLQAMKKDRNKGIKAHKGKRTMQHKKMQHHKRK